MNQDEDEKKKLKAQIASLEKQLKSKHDKQMERSLEIAKLKVKQEKIRLNAAAEQTTKLQQKAQFEALQKKR